MQLPLVLELVLELVLVLDKGIHNRNMPTVHQSHKEIGDIEQWAFH
jgi:hypothetical protein